MNQLKAARRGKAAAQVDSAAIYERVAEAIGSHRLAPGTKLGEEALGEIFGVSRTKVRQALFQLSSDKLVTLIPGRGAFVAQPSVREAREVFEARRAVEGALVARFIERAGERELTVLRQHMAQQKQALEQDSVHQRNRLLGDFHNVLARLAGNEVMAELVEELVARTSLITLFYQNTRGATESFDEHVEFMEALEARDAGRAVKLMQVHLSDVENDLVLREDVPQASDLKEALA
ncbi:MAG: GntR family transcriptional regulator [Burkholderiales bacterium]